MHLLLLIHVQANIICQQLQLGVVLHTTRNAGNVNPQISPLHCSARIQCAKSSSPSRLNWTFSICCKQAKETTSRSRWIIKPSRDDSSAAACRDQPTFDIDLKAMRRQFLMLQQKAHPDSFSQAPKVGCGWNQHGCDLMRLLQRELDYAQLQSSVINKAYHTLKDPLSRAQYLLKEQGIQVNEGDSLSDPELLMEVMEFREELEEAQSEADIKPLKARNDGKIAMLCACLQPTHAAYLRQRNTQKQCTSSRRHLRRRTTNPQRIWPLNCSTWTA